MYWKNRWCRCVGDIYTQGNNVSREIAKRVSRVNESRRYFRRTVFWCRHRPIFSGLTRHCPSKWKQKSVILSFLRPLRKGCFSFLEYPLCSEFHANSPPIECKWNPIDVFEFLIVVSIKNLCRYYRSEHLSNAKDQFIALIPASRPGRVVFICALSYHSTNGNKSAPSFVLFLIYAQEESNKSRSLAAT